MTTATDNLFEREPVRPQDEPAEGNPAGPETSRTEMNTAEAPAVTSSMESAAEATLGAERNGNGAAGAEAEPNGDAWAEEAGENEDSSPEGEDAAGEAMDADAPAGVAEKLKSKLRRKNFAAEIKKLKADLDKAASDKEALRDKYLRLAAEFDNYRKRIDRDFNQRVQSAFAELVSELLPVLDDLERSLNTPADQQNLESLQNGVRLIQQKFVKVLADRGVEPIQAVGAEFDPNLHDALTEMAVEGKPSGLVLEEHTKGYMYRDRVLRPAKVIVSK